MYFETPYQDQERPQCRTEESNGHCEVTRWRYKLRKFVNKESLPVVKGHFKIGNFKTPETVGPFKGSKILDPSDTLSLVDFKQTYTVS